MTVEEYMRKSKAVLTCGPYSFYRDGSDTAWMVSGRRKWAHSPLTRYEGPSFQEAIDSMATATLPPHPQDDDEAEDRPSENWTDGPSTADGIALPSEEDANG